MRKFILNLCEKTKPAAAEEMRLRVAAHLGVPVEDVLPLVGGCVTVVDLAAPSLAETKPLRSFVPPPPPAPKSED